ncbi:MAG: helix-turn-helix domain-containing protein [Candidatus Sumerlaeia bacterium]|jgi:excisionase family DNA binding protein|nr:helix-turn-helix domain-containing protein [Candidatus Sumerlaeia bacterium]
MPDQRWLSVPEAAEYLGIKPDTVYEWIGKKGMPAHRVGRLWRLDVEEIDAWVKSGKAGAPDAQAEGESH